MDAERENTDASLRVERQKTDQALVDRQTRSDASADLVVEQARAGADAVVAAARGTVDRLLVTSSEEPATPATAVVDRRAAEDDLLQAARTDADEALLRQRAESARALTALLPLEREKTDRYLLTERARADDAITHRDDFLGIVTHDLRDLLSGIVLSAALLDEAPAENGGAKRRIQRYAARMNRLIGDLIDVASIDAGRLKIVPALSDWSALEQEVAAVFEPLASTQGITLEIPGAGAPLMMRFDHDRMLQVFANLIANALKFTPRGGAIRVHTERQEAGLCCVVRDTGSGIPRHLLESVFQRFWQTRSNDRRGVGLGLYITRCIIEAHGGRVWAESAVGSGSTLRFTLPIG